MKTILAPVDFSDVTSRVVQEAAALAHALDARVVLLHVVQPVVGLVDYAAIAFSTVQVDESAVKIAASRLARFHESLNQRGLEVDILNIMGSPVEEIIEQAHKRSADYIVIGSHGHAAVYNLLVGSTTNGVLKRATCPVMIVPSAARQLAAAANVGLHGFRNVSLCLAPFAV